MTPFAQLGLVEKSAGKADFLRKALGHVKDFGIGVSRTPKDAIHASVGFGRGGMKGFTEALTARGALNKNTAQRAGNLTGAAAMTASPALVLPQLLGDDEGNGARGGRGLAAPEGAGYLNYVTQNLKDVARATSPFADGDQASAILGRPFDPNSARDRFELQAAGWNPFNNNTQKRLDAIRKQRERENNMRRTGDSQLMR